MPVDRQQPSAVSLSTSVAASKDEQKKEAKTVIKTSDNKSNSWVTKGSKEGKAAIKEVNTVKNEKAAAKKEVKEETKKGIDVARHFDEL